MLPFPYSPLPKGLAPAPPLSAKRRPPPSQVLHKLVDPFVHRRSSELLRSALPLKLEFALCCRLTPLQRAMYDGFLHEEQSGQGGLSVLACLSKLQQVFNHPAAFYRALEAKREAKGRARSQADFDSMDDFMVSDESSDEGGKKRGKKQKRAGMLVALGVKGHRGSSDAAEGS